MTARRLAVFVLLLLAPAPVMAQRLSLTVTPAVITFPTADPDTVALMSAAPVDVTYRVRQNNNSSWRLTVRADGDLIAGSSTVDIGNVTWVATPAPPFQNGTMSRTVARTVASGNGNVNPARTGSITFRVANSWTYSVGTYRATVTFTLTAP